MATRIQIMSDVHQEFSKVPMIKEETLEAGVVLLAGDITTGPARIEYLKNYKQQFYYVMGNHEYYRASWSWALDAYRTFFKDTNVHVMERETILIGNVRLIAATLWTNFQAPMKSYLEKEVREMIGQPEVFWEDQERNCKQGMADFSVIGGFTTKTALEEHNKSVGYIKEVLSKPHDGPTVVMTHHAPSFKSSHPKYDVSYIKGGFCSALDYLIEEYQPTLWVHGHTHESFDYHIGNTRVICNPHGYGLENKHGFNPKLIVEL
jgi:predicted phosphodiesterase